MSLSTNTKANVPFKLGLNFGHTSNSDEFYAEPYGSAFVIASQNIWGDSIDSDPSVAQAAGIVSQEITLDLDVINGTTGSGSAYLATLPVGELAKLSPYINPFTGTNYTTGDRVGHIIPVFFGIDYKAVIRKGDTSILSEGDTSNWLIDPFGGIVTLETASVVPATITCRVFTGKLLDTKINDLVTELDNAIISGGGVPYSEIERLDNEDIQIRASLSALSGQVQAIPSDVVSLSDLISVSGSLQGDIDAIDTRVTTNEGDILSLQNDILSISASGGAVLPSEIDDLQAQIIVVSGGVVVVADDLATHIVDSDNANSVQDSAFTDLVDNTVTPLSSTVSGHTSDISVLQSQATSISGDVTINIADIAQLQIDLANAVISGGSVDTASFNALEARVTVNESDVLSISGDVVTLDSTVSSLNASVIGNVSNISTNATDISTLQGEVLDLQSETATISGDLDTLEQTVNSLQVGGVTQSELISVSGALDAKITINTDDIIALDSRVTTNEGDIVSIQNDILSLSVSGGVVLPSQIDDLQAQIIVVSGGMIVNTSDISTLQSQTTTISGDLDTLEQQFNSLDVGDVTQSELVAVSGALQNNIDNVNLTVISNTSNISTNGSDILTLQGQVIDLETDLVSISGNLQAQIDNISISGGQGEQGIQGETGIQGISGEQGPQGPQGESGDPIDLTTLTTDIATTANISGAFFYGDGSNLINLPVGGVEAYEEAIGDGASTIIAVTHGLGTLNVIHSMRDSVSGEIVQVSAEITDADTMTFTFTVAPTTDEYTVSVFSGSGTSEVKPELLDYSNLPLTDPSIVGRMWIDGTTLRISGIT
jgi:hypothetical protein